MRAAGRALRPLGLRKLSKQKACSQGTLALFLYGHRLPHQFRGDEGKWRAGAGKQEQQQVPWGLKMGSNHPSLVLSLFLSLSEKQEIARCPEGSLTSKAGLFSQHWKKSTSITLNVTITETMGLDALFYLIALCCRDSCVSAGSNFTFFLVIVFWEYHLSEKSFLFLSKSAQTEREKSL